MNFKSLTYLISIFIFSFSVRSQSAINLGTLPSVNINKKINDLWSMNTKIESRGIYKSVDPKGITTQEYTHELSDLTWIMSRNIGINSRISAGYMLRLEEGEIHQRFIQQFTIVQRKNGYRLAHRMVTDQTFSPSENPEFRVRYRASVEIPLNGLSLDNKELYIKANNEYLNSIQNKQYDIEIRIVPLLGYVLSEKIKIEAGLDYRLSSFLIKQTEQDFWFSMNLFVEY